MADSAIDEEFFTQEIGPLPMWAWIGIVGGGIGLYLRFRRKSVPDTPVTVPGASDTGFGTTRPGIGGLAPTPGMDTPSTPSGPVSNHSWSVKAQNILVGLGYDPVIVASALGKYLSGQPLSRQEQSIVSEALRSAGPTPEPVPPPVTAPATPAPTTPTTPAVEYWDTWKAHQDATGKPIPGTQFDWGEIARRTLPDNPTKNDVYFRALALHAKYKNLATRYPMYVPAEVAATITYP